MNNINLDKNSQNFQNQNFQENINELDNISNPINNLSMDELFRELLIIKHKNAKENNEFIQKRNFNFLESYTKIPNVIITISEIRTNYDKGIKFNIKLLLFIKNQIIIFL
jgi:hypothetical protein